MKNTIKNCNVIELPKIHNRSGNLTVLENLINIPFKVKRVYYLYDVPGGSDRGGHSHRELQQILVSVSGAFDVLLDDGENKKIVHLDRPYIGLTIPPGIWREILNFSSGAICLVLASLSYNEEDYIRDYFDYQAFRNST
jgi:dTDP-4-dehydrorhamnose 3,5-epimerase-like enzyme